MREFLLREFDAMSELWQGYADELVSTLDRPSPARRDDIERDLSTIENVIVDLNELLHAEDKENLDKDLAVRAEQLRERYVSLQKALMLKQATTSIYDSMPGQLGKEARP